MDNLREIRQKKDESLRSYIDIFKILDRARIEQNLAWPTYTNKSNERARSLKEKRLTCQK